MWPYRIVSPIYPLLSPLNLRLDVAQATLTVGRLNEILGKLEAVCCKHTQPDVSWVVSEHKPH